MINTIKRTLAGVVACALMFLLASFAPLAPAMPDKGSIRVFADALYEGGQYIAVIEIPGIQEEPRALSTGVVPLYAPDFLQVGLENSFMLADVRRSIKGEFDSLVIMPDIMVSSDNWNTEDGVEKPFFLPFPKSRWIVALKRSIKDGKATTDWLKGIKDLGKYKSFLNENTAYELVEDPDGAICLQWPPDQEKSEELYIADAQLPADLQSMAAAVQKAPADRKSVEARTMIEKAVNSLKTDAGKAIGQELLKRYPGVGK